MQGLARTAPAVSLLDIGTRLEHNDLIMVQPEPTNYIASITKIYPNKIRVIQYNKPYIPFVKSNTTPVSIRENKEIDNKIRVQRRTKSLVQDITLCNTFNMWSTLTFDCQNCPPNSIGNRICLNSPCICDPSTCFRFSREYCYSVVQSWLKSQRRTNPDFRYVIVGEYHKNKAFHFHALTNGQNGDLFETEKKDRRGKPVYNILDWTYGFSESVPINEKPEDYAKIASYLTKYITKESTAVFNGKQYWCSKGLKRPLTMKNVTIPFDDIDHVRRIFVTEYFRIYEHFPPKDFYTLYKNLFLLYADTTKN